MSSLRHTAFKLVVAGGIAVASGLLALYKLSVEPVVLEDADGLGLVPGSSSMTGGSNTSSGSNTPETSTLKRSPITSPQTGMSRLGSFSTLATLAEEDEEDYEAYSPVKAYVANNSAAASAAVATASADEEEPDWGDGPDSPSQPTQTARLSGAEVARAQLEMPSGLLAQLQADEATIASVLHPSWSRSLQDPPSIRPLSSSSSLRSVMPTRLSA